MTHRNRSHLRLLILYGAGLISAAASVMAVPADASDQIGWVYADQPTLTTPYSPNAAYSYNSSGGGITITRMSKGFYQADFADLNSTKPSNVQVTAVGGNSQCASSGWSGSGSDVTAYVTCVGGNTTGYTDSAFTLFYQARSALLGNANKGLAFVLSDELLPDNYEPGAAYSYNSTGGTNSITGDAYGQYTVFLPGLTKKGGTVQVTAWNGDEMPGGGARCRTGGSFTSSSGTTVGVLCFDFGGEAGPEEFTLVYSLDEPLAETPGVTLNGAYAWANKPSETTVYTPPSAYNYNGFGTGKLTAQNTGTGRYAIGIPGSPNFSSSTVLLTTINTASNTDSNYCNVGQLFPITVNCFKQDGKPINSAFIVNFQTAQ
jgi:hypothetical protein